MDTRCALSRTNTDDEYWQPATPISSSQLTLATACLKIHEVLIPLTFQNEHSHVAKIYIYVFIFLFIHHEKCSKYRAILISDDLRSRKTGCSLFFLHICSATKEAKLILTC